MRIGKNRKNCNFIEKLNKEYFYKNKEKNVANNAN